MPERIQRRRDRPGSMPPGTIYVGRPTKWGNPFVAGSEASRRLPFAGVIETIPIPTRAHAVALYRDWILNPHSVYITGRRPLRAAATAELRGHDLACWCPLVDENGQRVPCHADVLLELANSEARSGA